MIRRKQPPVEAEDIQPKGFDAFELRLGDIMRGERATLGKSLLDVQRELKIKATYIAAIENADPTAFETPGFIAGYVRSYARYLGLDPEWAYQTFCREGNFANVNGMEAGASPKPAAKKPAVAKGDPLADPNATFVPRGEALLGRIEPGAIGSSLVLLALIGALGYGGWSVLKEIQRVNLAPVEQAPGVLAELDPLAGVAAPQTDIEEAEAGTAAANAAPTTEALDRLYRPQALEVPVLVARDGPISTLPPGAMGALAMPEPPQLVAAAEPVAEDAPDIEDAAVKVVEDRMPELAIFATHPAWVRVRAADGTVLFEKILDAGENYVLPKTEEPPVLRAGNSGSVYFAVNGEAYGPAANGAQVVKNLVLEQAALKESFQPVDLTTDPGVATTVAELRAQWQEASAE